MLLAKPRRRRLDVGDCLTSRAWAIERGHIALIMDNADDGAQGEKNKVCSIYNVEKVVGRASDGVYPILLVSDTHGESSRVLLMSLLAAREFSQGRRTKCLKTIHIVTLLHSSTTPLHPYSLLDSDRQLSSASLQL